LSLRSSALALNQAYRVRLNGAVIKDANGNFLDGEFNGMEALSGNGHAGGNFDIVAKPATKAKVRFTTIAGFINVGLYNNTPNTKTNFLHYTNEGAYDETIIHRSVRFADPSNPPNQAFQSQFDILQGGGYLLDTAANHTTKVHNHGPINNEGTNLNTKGTIAMANAGANTATTEYFFNVNSNTAAFDTTLGTYAVFGAVLDPGSQETLDALSALETSQNNLFPLSEDGQAGTGHEFGHYNVPVRSVATINARGSISDNEDLVIVTRVAQLFDYGATPNVQSPGAVKAAAAVTAPAATAPALSPAIATTFSAKKIEDEQSLFDAAA
jgi:cyclophilin family peptidyl-prolyl cis-trans isomerase